MGLAREPPITAPGSGCGERGSRSSARMRSNASGALASSVATGRVGHEPPNASVNGNASDPPRSDRHASTILLSRATYDASPGSCLPLLRPQANHRSGRLTSNPSATFCEFPAPHFPLAQHITPITTTFIECLTATPLTANPILIFL